MSEIDTRNIIKKIIEEQRISMSIKEDKISLTNETKIDEQEDIQQAWPKAITYKEGLLFDQYNMALQQAIKLLNIDKTRVVEYKVDENSTHDTEYAYTDRYVSTSEDKTANDMFEKRVRITGQIKYFSYIISKDRFVLGFDMIDVEPVGNVNDTYVSLITCEFKYSNEYQNECEIIIENNEKISINYDDNIEFIEGKVKKDNKEDDVIVIFSKKYFIIDQTNKFRMD